MSTEFYRDEATVIRSMMPSDAAILYDTYLSYGWQGSGTGENRWNSTRPASTTTTCCYSCQNH